MVREYSQLVIDIHLILLFKEMTRLDHNPTIAIDSMPPKINLVLYFLHQEAISPSQDGRLTDCLNLTSYTYHIG